jgi:hypothetical protein
MPLWLPDNHDHVMEKAPTAHMRSTKATMLLHKTLLLSKRLSENECDLSSQMFKVEVACLLSPAETSPETNISSALIWGSDWLRKPSDSHLGKTVASCILCPAGPGGACDSVSYLAPRRLYLPQHVGRKNAASARSKLQEGPR